MHLLSRNILVAAINEKRELVQSLYLQGYQDEGEAEYKELKKLGMKLREVINGDPERGNQGTGEDTQPE
jgi:hypothetical protein